ncbi:MAG: magnesium chelatase subunit D family protein, partial [Pseudomonadota bacterium]
MHGQDEMKEALLMTAVNPRIGGVLIRGEKGTAKSTAVRGLAALLPEIEVVTDCPLGCSPDEASFQCSRCHLCSAEQEVNRRPVRVVTLPLNATEDRVAGGMDFDRAIRNGQRTIQPGLLAQSHRGILYVDEINLLDDHLVDAVLGAAASGENRIEREGISFSHPARFILVGTMNPEEGELRPQLLDRFGLCVEVKGVEDRDLRVQTMVQRETFDANPEECIREFDTETKELAQQIYASRSLLKKVCLSGRLRALVSELCLEAGVAGHRADLVIEQAARARAALQGRIEVEEEDIMQVAPLALRHRQRDPAPPPPPPQEKSHDQHSHSEQQQDHQDGEAGEQAEKPTQTPDKSDNASSEAASGGGMPDDGQEPQQKPDQNVTERVSEVGATFKVKQLTAGKDRVFRRGSGRRSRSRVNGLQGRYVKSTLPRGSKDVALDATLRAAAPHQRNRKRDCDTVIALRSEDIREKVRERRIGNFLLFVVDASGSMGARGRMAATKGAIMSLLLDAYQKRDKVAMISFSKTEARLNLPPTSSIDMAARVLAEMPVGGRTPLSTALIKTQELLNSYLVRDPTSRPIVILITDGRCNVALAQGKPIDESLALAGKLAWDERNRFILVDTEEKG